MDLSGRLRRRRAWAFGGGLALLLSVLAASGPTPFAVAAGGTPVINTMNSATGTVVEGAVTLITGDQVTATEGGGVTVEPGKDRDDVTFLAQHIGDELHVIPSDALPLLREGRLDKRLFNVTLLQETAYQDRSQTPLIVTGDRGAGTARVPAPIRGAEVVADLPAVNGVAIEVDKEDAGTVWSHLTDQARTGKTVIAAGVSKVWLDGLRQPLLDEAAAQIGAPAAWDLGLDGSGTTVAVLDTGIDAAHPDLADQIASQMNFTEGREDDRDLVGHGTHVAGTVAGTGAASEGRYRGIAHGGHLLDGKVCARIGCRESWVLAGMQWAAEQGADVINMSLGGPDTPEVDPLEQAVETLTDEYGVLFVIAAGNEGGDATVSSPASADAALAVGAVDKSDELADFSSRGPRIDGALKPDLSAPGVQIVAARSADGSRGEPGESYVALSGTSMATPMVAGSAAILAQQHPDWSPDQIKTALMNSAAPNTAYGPYALGNGRVDVAQAIEQTVTSSPASVSFEQQLWPHNDDQPQTQTVTYRNDGDTAVTLNLSLTTIGPDGQSVPEGLFTLSADTVTVPVGGTADVDLTVDTSRGDVGFSGGYLTAAGDMASVTTAFAVDLEVESYDVTLVHTDRSGAPVSNYRTSLFTGDRSTEFDLYGGPNTVTLRVPAGDYTLMSFVGESAAEDFHLSLLSQPRLHIDGDQTVAVDAQQARPISVSVPEKGAAVVMAIAEAAFAGDTSTVTFTAVVNSFSTLSTGRLGPDQMVDEFSSAITGHWAQRNTEGGFSGTPYAYHAMFHQEGRMMTGLDRTVRRGELAVVQADHAAHAADSSAEKAIFGFAPGASSSFGPYWQEELPFSRTEYHTTVDGVQWKKDFNESASGAGLITIAQGPLTEYQTGRGVHESWNLGVFGPVLQDEIMVSSNGNRVGRPPVSRTGDQLLIAPSVFGDSDGRTMQTRGTRSMKVFRNGELFAQGTSTIGTVDVPHDTAEYRVEIDAARSEPYLLSTQTSLAWEFESGHVDGTEALPVSVVRFKPALDDHNIAPAGRPFLVPVQVQHGTAVMDTVTIEASFDDGQTWSRVPVIGGRQARVTHPNEDGFVSLRSTVTDVDGNTTTQTIIRAYQIKRAG